MTEAILTEQKRRRWNPFRRRRFVLRIPQCWGEVSPVGRRERWWRWAAMLPEESARSRILKDLVPRRFLKRMSDLDKGALASQLEWTKAVPDCENIPVPGFFHKDIEYAFPSAKGTNVSCVEFAMCDDYYKAFVEGDASAALCVTACLWREREENDREALKRGDRRVPLYSKEEVEARAAALKSAPAEIHVQALTWWIGMKMLVNRMYGAWLFEEEEEEDDADETPGAPKPTDNRGPNFGWWGIFLDVAEAGVFGPLEKVYQTSIHDVCILLVKKRADANAQPQANNPPQEDNED